MNQEYDKCNQKQDVDLNIKAQSNKIRKFYVLIREKHFYTVLGSSLLITSAILYQSTLQICPFKYEIECAQDFLLPSLKPTIIKDIIAVLLSLFLFILILQNKISILFLFIYCILQIYFFILSGHEMTATNYQFLFQLTFLAIFLIIYLFAALSFLIVYLWRKFKIAFVFTFMILLLSIVTYISYLYQHSCDTWANGLNYKQIEQTYDSCQIEQPKYCEYDIVDGLFDLTKFSSLCHKQQDSFSKEDYLNYLSQYINITKDTKLLEFPRTEYFAKNIRYYDFDEYQAEVLSNIKPLNSSDQLSDQAELYLNLTSLKFMIDVKKNKTLAEQRNQKFIQSPYKKPKNIITIWIDAVSRSRFIKKMPKSMKKLETIHKDFGLQLYEAFKYISVGVFSFPAYLAYEYGLANINENHNLFENWTMFDYKRYFAYKPAQSLQENLQEQGYIVGKAREQCQGQLLELMDEHKSLLKPSVSDHELISLACDINWSQPSAPYNLKKGPYSIFRRCTNQRNQYEYVFEYGRKFLNAYRDEPKYLEMYFLEGHEGTGEVITLLDDPLEDFLNFIVENNYDEDSIIFIGSDHGLHMSGIAYLLDFSIREKDIALPGMFLLMDKSLLSIEDQDNLIQNEQRGVWIKDLNQLIQYYISPNETEREIYKSNSLLASYQPFRRSCLNIPKPEFQFCPCI